MHTARNLLAALAIAVAPAASATNFSDLWWNPQESGWGAQVVQQGETAFVTLFVYGGNGEPLWLVAPGARTFAYGANGLPHFRGTLYRTRGPAFSGPFDPQGVQAIPVGELYVSPVDDGTIRVDYAVNNIAVQKTLVRQTFARPSVAANYAGAFRLRMALGATPYGTREYNADFLVHLNEQGEGVMRVEDAIQGLCEYRGPYVQRGRYGSFAGSYGCANGAAGTFEVSRLEFTEGGVTGSFKLAGPDGNGTGRFGAVRQ